MYVIYLPSCSFLEGKKAVREMKVPPKGEEKKPRKGKLIACYNLHHSVTDLFHFSMLACTPLTIR